MRVCTVLFFLYVLFEEQLTQTEGQKIYSNYESEPRMVIIVAAFCQNEWVFLWSSFLDLKLISIPMFNFRFRFFRQYLFFFLIRLTFTGNFNMIEQLTFRICLKIVWCNTNI